MRFSKVLLELPSLECDLPTWVHVLYKYRWTEALGVKESCCWGGASSFLCMQTVCKVTKSPRQKELFSHTENAAPWSAWNSLFVVTLPTSRLVWHTPKQSSVSQRRVLTPTPVSQRCGRYDLFSIGCKNQHKSHLRKSRLRPKTLFLMGMWRKCPHFLPRFIL